MMQTSYKILHELASQDLISKLWVCHLRVTRRGASPLTSRSLSVFICKMDPCPPQLLC